jgi:hypothetical protein
MMDREEQKALSERIAGLGEHIAAALETLGSSKVVEDLEVISATLTQLGADFATLAEDVRVALGDPPAEIPDAQPRPLPPAPEA